MSRAAKLALALLAAVAALETVVVMSALERGPRPDGLLERALRGGARVIDLTHALDPSLAVWPGDPPFAMSPRATIEADGYLAHRFALGDGCGTHLDAPAHFAPGGATIERLAPVDLIAEACVVDVREACARDPDYEVTVEDVERFERVHGAIPARAVVIARTGWSARARDAEAYAGAGGDGKLHFPGFSEACARWLLDGRDVKGLAIDALSPDPGRRDGHPVHRLVLGAGRFLVENLTNLDRVPPRGAVLVVLPIRVAGAGQAPCRAIAIAP